MLDYTDNLMHLMLISSDWQLQLCHDTSVVYYAVQIHRHNSTLQSYHTTKLSLTTHTYSQAQHVMIIAKVLRSLTTTFHFVLRHFV